MIRYKLRAFITIINGSTPLAMLLVVFTKGDLYRGHRNVLVCPNYSLRWPYPNCFTIGNVIFTRHTLTQLLSEEKQDLYSHEEKHVNQFALFGLFFFPLYWIACGWSYWRTSGKNYGTYNIFERHAGLEAGGYQSKKD